MSRLVYWLILLGLISGCSGQTGTIAQLRRIEIDIEDVKSIGSLDKAIESYEHYLKETSETPKTPEAIRRLADLKVEKEYGLIAESAKPEAGEAEPAPPVTEKPVKKRNKVSEAKKKIREKAKLKKGKTRADKRPGDSAEEELPPQDDLKRVGALEAVSYYRKLLAQYPDYDRNDQVLYQLSRALEEQGEVEEAMQVMDRLVTEYPRTSYLDEVQFRRGEYFFSRRKFADAETAYGSVVDIGEISEFYVLALYKLGWSLYKQELYEEALHQYIALIDYKVANRFNLDKIPNNKEGKRVKDTLRIIGQSFSNLGGVDTVIAYFSRYGKRQYEYVVYDGLADYSFSKQRYADAVKTYSTFIKRNPLHRQAPIFSLKVIAINEASGFGSLIVQSKKDFVSRYGFGADYWKHFNPDYRQDVVAGLKVTLIDLANHYHALYQNEKFAGKKKENLKEALHWYREYLGSFPLATETAAINFQLAELLLENKMYGEAAQEYEKTAYVYPVFEKAEEAGYAAVFAYREHLKSVPEKEEAQVKRDIIRVSLKFAEHHPKHKKAAVVLAAAVDELYVLRDFKTARIAGHHLIQNFPNVSTDIRRSAFLVVAHSAFELKDYSDAEIAYTEALTFYPENDKKRQALLDNLVASIYKQGEAANLKKRYKKAAEHFLKVATVAPNSKIRPAADFDGAVALMQVEEWPGAIDVLVRFRELFPEHKLQHEVTKKLAFIYREDGKLGLAAVEFERIDKESDDVALSQEALMMAGELYGKLKQHENALAVYRRYVEKFPEPVDLNIEARHHLATIYDKQGRREPYLDALRKLVDLESSAGSAQTARTRHLAGKAALVLAEHDYEIFISIRLVMPFEKNLQRKQALMRKVTQAYSDLFKYEDGAVTSEATYFLAETYADFSSALMKSERPQGLSPLEMEEYELALEEQAYPFEDKTIEMHQDNLALMKKGLFNKWVEKSLAKLTVLLPARYGKTEMENRSLVTMTGFRFENKALEKKIQTDSGRPDSSGNIQVKQSGKVESAR